jgi:hypothetical protein
VDGEQAKPALSFSDLEGTLIDQMPTMHDALGLWGISAALAAYLGLCVAFGKAPKKFGGFLKRSENPGVFWTVIGIGSIGLIVLIFLAIYASMPWTALGF